MTCKNMYKSLVFRVSISNGVAKKLLKIMRKKKVKFNEIVLLAQSEIE